MAFGMADRLRHWLEYDADRIGHEGRRRILPERVVRLRAHRDIDGLLQIVVFADGNPLLLRHHHQGAGRNAGLALGGVDFGARRVGFEVQRLKLLR